MASVAEGKPRRSVIDIVDSTAVARLNGFSGLEELRERGRLVLPDAFGVPMTFDLTKPYRPLHVLIEEYWRFHPRYLFFKSVPERGRLADLGAGSGGLVGWKLWGEPLRQDLLMYAVDLEKGDYFDQYVDYDIVELGRNDTKFPDDIFDSVILSHVLEHVADRNGLANEVARIARPGAKVYVEWPTEQSGTIVSRAELRPLGIQCSTLNFFDDQTHLDLVSQVTAESVFRAAGFLVVTSGEIVNDYLFPELLRCGIHEESQEATTYALWLAFGFSRYMILEKKTA